MDYDILLDLATDLGYELAMNGAETYRVEESINKIIGSYGVHSEVFAIPNLLIVSITSNEDRPITRMRRIGYHGSNLDTVERLNALSRKICSQLPSPPLARQWLNDIQQSPRVHTFPAFLLGNFLGSAGFSCLFGCSGMDIFWSGVCGLFVGIVNHYMARLKANPFFSTLAASFLMALLAHIFSALGIVQNADTVIIGALMLLVPGLLFTNAMRDIIYGDTNSGVNRIVQVFLIAAALALGTAAAWNIASRLLPLPLPVQTVQHPLIALCIASLIGCIGFSILFNIHGPGMLLCALGGMLAWAVFDLTVRMGGSEISGYFWGAVLASFYAEIMARIRKYPTISYLVTSLFPLIPGAGVYYSMTRIVQGNMEAFASQGAYTAAIAGAMAAGILLVSTAVRLYYTWKQMRQSKHA